MTLAAFTTAIPANSRILINPDNVVAVTPFNNVTYIHVSVVGANGQPFVYIVTETFQQVQQELNRAMG